MSHRRGQIVPDRLLVEERREKRRRLRMQEDFLTKVLGSIDLSIRKAREVTGGEAAGGRAPDRDGGPSKMEFIAAAVQDGLRDEADILEPYLEDTKERIAAIVDDLAPSMEETRLPADRGGPRPPEDRVPLCPRRSEAGRREVSRMVDIADLDKAIGHLERSLEYLKSCRRFLLQEWGCLETDLRSTGSCFPGFVRHVVGQANEMAANSDCNLILALRQLLGVESLDPGGLCFRKVLVDLLGCLHDDIYSRGTLGGAVRCVEETYATNLGLTEAVKEKRAMLVKGPGPRRWSERRPGALGRGDGGGIRRRAG